MNHVNLMGRLTHDPELKTTTSGVYVTKFLVAVPRNYIKEGEERKSDFIDVVAWRKTAEFVCKYFIKGQLIALDGYIQIRIYIDKKEQKRKAFEVVAEKITFTGDKRQKEAAASQSPVSGTLPETLPETIENITDEMINESGEVFLPDDDLPF